MFLNFYYTVSDPTVNSFIQWRRAPLILTFETRMEASIA